VHACEHVIPWVVEAGGGSVLLVTSISGLECDPSPDNGYTAAKTVRLGSPDEMADVAVFLVSRRAHWVTGECVSFDGAQHRGMR